ncbi:MAG: cobyric acid synthase CobQ, partial [Eubacterium sp.]
LKESKLADEIIRFHEAGVPVIGICGGYQILGEVIEDPHGVESNVASIEGLGLLAMKTVLEEEKRTTRVNGLIKGYFMGIDLAESPITGYEIHMGDTTPLGDTTRFAILEDGRADGGISVDGSVMGTYLHGIFDNDVFREKLIEKLKKKKNISSDIETGMSDFKAFKESQYDLLAETVEKSLDMPKLLEIIGV